MYVIMKISGIHIKHFRGIPSTCSLNFVDKNNKACSTIIYGGNGRGKSSIVDAIEYNLQGRIGRSFELNNHQRPSAINFASHIETSPKIEVKFDDGSDNVREINLSYDESGLPIYRAIPNAHALEQFQNVPIALRRNDIIQFNNTHRNKRQVLLIQFIYNYKYHINDTPVLMALEERSVILKQQRKSILEKISSKTKFEIDQMKQYSSDTIESYVRQRLSPIGQRFSFEKRTGKPKRTLPEHIFNQVIDWARQADKINSDIKKINAEKKKEKHPGFLAQQDLITPFYEAASRYLSNAFKYISNADYIEYINLQVGKSTVTSFEIEIILRNGKSVSPNQIFSEANYDLMVLLLYLSIIRVGVDNGQEKLLIIDDVLQSVDANIRVKFIDYILRELSDWQFIITCHDRLWLNQLRELFKLKSHTYKEYNISNWSFETGPTIMEINHHSMDETLKQAISTSNTRIIASMAGVFFEKICHELSISLRGSIERKPDDKYTIGDLWPSVLKHLKQTPLKETVEDIDNFKHVRNLLGGHYNEWADMMSDDEVLHFAQLVQKLYEQTFCSNCMKWISRNGKKDYYCHCRSIQY